MSIVEIGSFCILSALYTWMQAKPFAWWLFCYLCWYHLAPGCCLACCLPTLHQSNRNFASWLTACLVALGMRMRASVLNLQVFLLDTDYSVMSLRELLCQTTSIAFFMWKYFFIATFISKNILLLYLNNQTVNRWTSGPTGKNMNQQPHRFDHRSDF
jgi:hypothetical protein